MAEVGVARSWPPPLAVAGYPGSHLGSFGHKFAGRTGTLDPSSVSYRSSWLSRHSRRPPAGYRGRMASYPARTPLGLFDNPVHVFSLDELAATCVSIPMNPIARSGVFDHRESEAA